MAVTLYNMVCMPDAVQCLDLFLTRASLADLMRVGLYRSSASEAALKSIRSILDDAKIEAVLAGSSHEEVPRGGSVEYMLVLGGDKGMREYFHRNVDASIPVLGIGEGERGGFLAQVELREFASYVEMLKMHDHTVEEFPRLGVRIDDAPQTFHVLNDVAIFPSKSAMLMEYTLRVAGDWVWHDNSDGVIISTPIGSSAYSMSAGGPVLFQDACVFEIISVNSLDVTRRPLIVSNSSLIEIDDVSSRLYCEAVLDGLDRLKVKKRLECSQFLPPARIIRPRRASTAIDALARKVHLAEDLLRMPPSSKLLLKTLEYEGELTHKDLVGKTLLPDRTVRLALGTLLKKGYVKRRVSARDARQKIYSISSKIE